MHLIALPGGKAASRAQRLDFLDTIYPDLRRHNLMNETEYRDISLLLAGPGPASDQVWDWLQEVNGYLRRLEGETAEQQEAESALAIAE